jgi:hypothetical protein
MHPFGAEVGLMLHYITFAFLINNVNPSLLGPLTSLNALLTATLLWTSTQALEIDTIRRVQPLASTSIEFHALN